MMATYFNGGASEIQADNLQTLYLMNPSYSDAPPPPPGMFLRSPAAHALNQGFVQHAPPPHLVGIPLHQSGSASPSPMPEIPGFAPRFHYNLGGGGGELGSPVGFRRPPPVSVAASTSLDHHHQHPQQLSLSLNNSPANKVTSPCAGTPTSASGISTGGGIHGGIAGSKYMKAAQQLLDETVNVWKAMNIPDSGREKAKAAIDSAAESSGTLKKEGSVPTAELSTAQRQEIQMKKAKLLNMLDEVEQRYRQYHSQMQAVAAALEQAAGAGSAKSYTALALHTISKQFRCLKDAIAGQIKEAGRSLGEEDDGRRESRSRLRLVDHHMRQQLSVMHHQHHNAWRPQRGLPERAVSVLRAWLFEHFLHPYPKDSDKHMLAKQTGLTRSQVSNWFINARVRLWKPMVEEMYIEETKGQQENESDDHNNNENDRNKDSGHTSKSTPTTIQSPRIPQNPNSINNIPNSTLVSPTPASTGPTLHGLGSALQGFSITGIESSKRQRSNTVVDIQNESQSSMILSMDHQMEMKDINTNHGGFGPTYPVGDIGSRFNPDHHHQLGHGHYHHSGNSVSLTLGLPHSENLLSSLSGAHHHQQNFMMPGQTVQLGRRPDIGIGETEFFTSRGGGGGTGGYEAVDIQNRKRFAAQLLSDFVV